MCKRQCCAHWLLCLANSHSPFPFFLLQVPGVPIMFIQAHRYNIERLPEATVGGAPRF